MLGLIGEGRERAALSKSNQMGHQITSEQLLTPPTRHPQPPTLQRTHKRTHTDTFWLGEMLDDEIKHHKTKTNLSGQFYTDFKNLI